MIDHGLNAAEAENAPRAHDQLFPDELRIERGMSPDTIRLLEAMGHKVVVREAMGSANTIVRLPDGELDRRLGLAAEGNAGGRLLNRSRLRAAFRAFASSFSVDPMPRRMEDTRRFSIRDTTCSTRTTTQRSAIWLG